MINNISVEGLLREQGIKPSYQRMKIMSYMMDNRIHPTVEDIYIELLPEIPTLSRTTVYNTLKLFKEKGLIRMLTIDEVQTRFDIDTAEHAHFLCVECGMIHDFELQSTPECSGLPAGFAVEEMQVYIKGYCVDCTEGGNESKVNN